LVPDYAGWKRQALAELERVESGARVLGERVWRDLYIRNQWPLGDPKTAYAASFGVHSLPSARENRTSAISEPSRGN